jgi:predicted ATP-binding protein involved in virulence
MIKLKNIKLINYCGFKNFELDLTEGKDVKKWTMLYGPNGSFKSSFLTAVSLLSYPMVFTKKKNILTFRKMKYHHDYSSGLETLYAKVNDLKMEALFKSKQKEKRVILEDNIQGVISSGRQVDEDEGEISGIRLNELSIKEQGNLFIDADSRNMMQKFQIIVSLQNEFCDFASSVFGFDCYCPEKAKSMDHGIEYCTDFVIQKNDTKVHYKRFSDGEKKLATLISTLFKRAYKNSPDKENKKIAIIDNIEQHIYWKRHMTLIEKMEEYFPDLQFIATTHSPIIINEMDKKYLVDMEEI